MTGPALTRVLARPVTHDFAWIGAIKLWAAGLNPAMT
jgi:hypothetical protein